MDWRPQFWPDRIVQFVAVGRGLAQCEQSRYAGKRLFPDPPFMFWEK